MQVPSPSQQQRALVCIPDSRLRGLFSMLLTDLGCSVTSCDEHGRADALARATPHQLCVTTATASPQAEALLDTLRKGQPRTRLLLVADPAQSQLLPNLVSRGVDALIFLPINAARCVDSLRKLLGADAVPTQTAGSLAWQGTAPAADTARASASRQHAEHSALPAASSQMRLLLRALRDLPQGSHIVALRGERGCEFELLAREFHRIQGGISPCIPRLEAEELDDENLRNALALARLQDEPWATLHLQGMEAIDYRQQSDLSAVIVEERRRRGRGKPVSLVMSFVEETPGADLPFIEELMFHNCAALRIPPLRERPDDIPGIALHVLTQLTILYPELRVRSIEPAALEWLCAQTWPGNHEQLVGVVREACMHCSAAQLSPAMLARIWGGTLAGDSTPPALVNGEVA